MRISELARCVDESASTIRFYESMGLLPDPPRTSHGYRDYERDAIGQIRLIRTFQSAGFSLEDISTLSSIATRAAGSSTTSSSSSPTREPNSMPDPMHSPVSVISALD